MAAEARPVAGMVEHTATATGLEGVAFQVAVGVVREAASEVVATLVD